MLLLNQYKTKELVRLIEERLSVIDIMKRVGIKTVKVGNVWRAYCFSHNDVDTPNLSHTEGAMNCAHCFKCGYAGGPIKIYRDYCKKTFQEALQDLSGWAGIDIANYIRESTPEELEKQKVIELNLVVAQWLHQQAQFYPDVMRYLLGRYDKQTIEKWKIGYSKSGEALRNHIVQKMGMSNDLFQKADVLPWRFDDRITYPIFDLQGNIVGFSNRTWANSKEEEEKKYGDTKKGGKYAKFVNTSSNSIVFKQKSKHLYGLNFAREAIKKQKGRVIIVEGFSDVIAMHKHGFENCVGIMSASFNSNSVEVLSSIGVTNVVFCLDGDDAGQDKTLLVMKAQKKLQGYLKENVMPIKYRAVSLPVDVDPDVFLAQKGKKAMQQILDRAMSLPEFYVNYAIKNSPQMKTITDRLDFIHGIKLAMRDALDLAELSLIDKFLLEKFGINHIDFELFCQAQKQIQERGSAENETTKVEVAVLSAIANDIEFQKQFVPQLTPEMFLHPNSIIFRAILLLHEDKTNINEKNIVDKIKALGFNRYFVDTADIVSRITQKEQNPYIDMVSLQNIWKKREIINFASDLIMRCQTSHEQDIVRFIVEKANKMGNGYEIPSANSK